jgi:hypothetical protein
MPNLRSIANEYHTAANKIAARADRAEKPLSENQHRAIDFYRESAAKIEALIRPEDSETDEAVWHLEGQERHTQAMSHKKVTSADKAATPQELIKKAEQTS